MYPELELWIDEDGREWWIDPNTGSTPPPPEPPPPLFGDGGEAVTIFGL